MLDEIYFFFHAITFHLAVLVTARIAVGCHDNNLFEIRNIDSKHSGLARRVAARAISRKTHHLFLVIELVKIELVLVVLVVIVIISIRSSCGSSRSVRVFAAQTYAPILLWCACVVGGVEVGIGIWGKGIFNKAVSGRVIEDNGKGEHLTVDVFFQTAQKLFHFLVQLRVVNLK